MHKKISQIMAIVGLAEKLKCVLRHSWTSDGRHESVAEHTWRLSLMVMLVADYVDKDIDTAKTLKMVIVHDLVEAICGDVPAFDLIDSKEKRALKEAQERAAIDRIAHMAPELAGQEIKALWEEFEDGVSYEARIALALDKLEAQIQHNEADLTTWTEIEKSMAFRLKRYTDFDSFIDELRMHIENASVSKLRNAGILADAYR
jgi:putative hydrolase of HD superfamily